MYLRPAAAPARLSVEVTVSSEVVLGIARGLSRRGWGQILLLGAIFSAIALVCDSAWALAAGTARSWLARSPRRLSALGGTSGLIMIGLGTALAVGGRKD